MLRAVICTDAPEEFRQRRTLPGADRAPAFNTDVTCDLRDFRERIKLFERPWVLVVDETGDFQLIGFSVPLGRIVFAEEAMKGKRPGDAGFGISRSELGAAE